MTLESLSQEDRFALTVTGGFHLLLILFFLLYTFTIRQDVRPSFIEVEFGEFRTGTEAQFAQQRQQAATRPDPPRTQPENPQPVETQETEQQQATAEETTKPVDAPEQQEEIVEEELETPETDKVDPRERNVQEEQEEIVVPPKTQQAETREEGAEESGDRQGAEGRVDADQGTGNEVNKSAPYELQWEGNIERSPMMQPLPENSTEQEAVITFRFEVRPDGTVGQLIPLRKSGNPELEREAMRTLRSWRFSRLPSGVPQQSQWGTITFRFILE